MKCFNSWLQKVKWKKMSTCHQKVILLMSRKESWKSVKLERKNVSSVSKNGVKSSKLAQFVKARMCEFPFTIPWSMIKRTEFGSPQRLCGCRSFNLGDCLTSSLLWPYVTLNVLTSKYLLFLESNYSCQICRLIRMQLIRIFPHFFLVWEVSWSTCIGSSQ